MKKKNSFTAFVSGMLVMLVLVCTVLPAMAASKKEITVDPGVNIYIDDQKLNPKDVNGNPVEVFIYNGTTYLPVRAVSEALGQVVQWEGATRSVYIGKHTGEKPAVWLSNLDYFYKEGNDWGIGKETTDNLGNPHQHCFYTRFKESIAYKLNAQYSALSGCFYKLYGQRSDTADATLKIYGDGELLYTATVTAGVDPIDFNIDISGVLELKIMIDDGGYYTSAAIGDLGLWT